MHVLLTGPFGNVGESTIEELVKQGHKVRCFDIKTTRNEKIAGKYGGQIEVVWGNIRRRDDVAWAVRDQEAILHLCFIIPSTTSITGVSSEARPEWAREINVGGTANIISAAKSSPNRPRIVFSSSTHVFGHTQNQQPPRRVSDPVYVTDHYTDHKLKCEEMVRQSGLEWVNLRFCAVAPIRFIMNADMFDIPLQNRIEFVHTKDVGLACANAITCQRAVGRTLLIGGGPRCQMYWRDMAGRGLEAFGIGMLPDGAFTAKEFCQDWIDTDESQELLRYQQRTYEDYIEDLKRKVGFLRHLARIFRPAARWYLLRKSPYYWG